MTFDDLAMYKKVKHQLLGKIESGEYGVGDQIPTELEMCRMFNVSRSTVRQAMQDLVNEGIVAKKQGKGTFVASINRSFSSLVISSLPVGAERSFRFLSAEQMDCDAALAETMGVDPGEKLFSMSRVRIESGFPVALKRYHVPQKLLADQPLTAEEMNTEVIDVILANRGMEVRSVNLSILPIAPTEEQRRLLEMPPETLCLKITEVGFSVAKATLRVTESIIRCDKAGYYMSITMISDAKSAVGRSYLGNPSW